MRQSKRICAKSLLTFLTIMLSVFLSCILFTSCNRSNRDSETIIVGTTAAIEKAIRDEYAYDNLASGVSEIPLVSKSANGEFKPLLASYKTSDSKFWTFTIVDGMKWSDGVSVTAEDIVFSLEFEATGDMPAFTNGDKNGTYAGYAISADGKSVTLECETANVKALDYMTTFRVRPKHIYEGKTAVGEAEARVSCGPYKLESFNKQASTLTFTVNEYYPAEPNFKRVVYKLFGSDDIMYAALLNGELDFVWNYSVGVPSAYQDLLFESKEVELESATATNCPAVLTFNNKTGLFSDKNLRYAVSYALDYSAFKTYFGSPYAETPNRSFAPSSLVGYKPTDKLETNLTKASEYMQAVGYVKSEGYWKKDGVLAEFDLTVNAGKETHVGFAEFVKTQLERFGIKVNIDSVSSAVYNVKTSNKFAVEQGSGIVAMEAAIMGFTSYGMQNFGDMYIDGNHSVQGGAQVFSDALTRIRSEMSEARTPEEYISAAGKLQDFYANEIPVIALYWDNFVYARSSALKNTVVDGTFGLNNIGTWFSATKN